MRIARSIVLCLLAAGCGTDPCGGQIGTCLSLDVRGEITIDTLRLDLRGAVSKNGEFKLPGGKTKPPIKLAVLLPAGGGALQVACVGELEGKTVALGKADVEVPPGDRRLAAIHLMPTGDATCNDGFRDGGETDIDCGGPCSQKCQGGQVCVQNGDCRSMVCGANQRCAAPSCSDKIQNGDESDVDCGGACPPCGEGQRCRQAGDCVNRLCEMGGTCRQAACDDSLKNGDETDLDCGGSCPKKCAPGKVCLKAADCESGICANGACAAPGCGDNLKNGDETDLDCGGACTKAMPPKTCAAGRGCAKNEDCRGGQCLMGKCAPTCADLEKSGDESDIDCGGSCAAKCATGKACGRGGDCKSGLCAMGKCGASCNDGEKNGDETDLDCGGTCPRCPLGRACSMGGDCRSGLCQTKLCAIPFMAKQHAAGRGPQQVLALDFNGDRRPDLAIPSYSESAVAVLLNDGKGGFFSPSSYAAGANPVYLAAADLGTNTLSLLVPSYAENRIRILVGDGMGGFTPSQVVFPSAKEPVGIVAGDFNKDGRADFACASRGERVVNFVVAQPNGTYNIYQSIDVQTALWALTSADFDGDGHVDLVATSEKDDRVLVMLGNGMGLFGNPLATPVPGYGGIAAADFNGDGRADLAIANTGRMGNFRSEVNVLIAKGGGAFNAPIALPTGLAPALLAAGDLDGDGKPDLVVPNTQELTISVLMNRGDGTFLPRFSYGGGTAPSSAAIADFNGDGKGDIAVSNFVSNDVTVLVNGLP